MTQQGATFTVNGQKREYADIWNAIISEKNAQQNTDLSKNKQITTPFAFTRLTLGTYEGEIKSGDYDQIIAAPAYRIDKATKKQFKDRKQ